MRAQFNEALAALSGSRRPPWALIPPGAHVDPFVSASEAASQAPTREATPAPEEDRRPRQPSAAPEAAPEPERAPELPAEGPAAPDRPEARRPGSRRKRARPPADDSDSRYPGRRRRAQPQPHSADAHQATKLARRARPTPSATPGRLGASAYQAVDSQGRFGLVECSRVAVPRGGTRPQAASGHTLVLAHTPPGRDPRALLDLYPGGTIRALRAGGDTEARADLRIGFVTRSGYFPPGRPATSVLLGVSTADWARASG